MSLAAEAIKRLSAEKRYLDAHRVREFAIEPLEDDVFVWHFTLLGPPDSPYAGGLYHGFLTFGTSYPFFPPDIFFCTPSGRFEVNQRICSTVSSFHPERWHPTWGISTVLYALREFMLVPGHTGIGSIEYPEAEKRKLAAASRAFRCSTCGIHVEELWETDLKLRPATSEEESEKHAAQTRAAVAAAAAEAEGAVATTTTEAAEATATTAPDAPVPPQEPPVPVAPPPAPRSPRDRTEDGPRPSCSPPGPTADAEQPPVGSVAPVPEPAVAAVAAAALPTTPPRPRSPVRPAVVEAGGATRRPPGAVQWALHHAAFLPYVRLAAPLEVDGGPDPGNHPAGSAAYGIRWAVVTYDVLILVSAAVCVYFAKLITAWP